MDSLTASLQQQQGGASSSSKGFYASLSAANCLSNYSAAAAAAGMPAAARGLSGHGGRGALSYEQQQQQPPYPSGAGSSSSGAAMLLPSAGLSPADTPLHAGADTAVHAAGDSISRSAAAVARSPIYTGGSSNSRFFSALHLSLQQQQQQHGIALFARTGTDRGGGALLGLPGGGPLLGPPLPLSTAESLEQQTERFASEEEFETMNLVKQRREFEEEKQKVWALFQQDKQNEYNKIKEERRQLQVEVQQQLKQVQVERNDARAKLQTEKMKFEQEVEAQRRQAVVERERFLQQVAAFESEKARVVDSNIATETVLDLNVGGVVFESSRQTLTQQRGSFLEALLSGRHRVARDRQGRVFLDRDAELFRIILNFLRQPDRPPQPRDAAESDALSAEAAFLGLHFFPHALTFAVGGHSGEEHLRSVEMFDAERQQWRPCAALLTERAYAACSAFQNRVLVYGGQNLDYKALCDAEAYDILRDCWISSSPLNVPRRNACGAAIGNRHFAIGGFDGDHILNSVECLDSRIKGWRLAAPLLSPRSSAMCCTHGDSLIVLGGTKGERLRTAEVYEQRMDRWEPLASPMMEVRSAGAAASADGHIFVVGGMDANHKGHSSLEVLGPDGKEWRFLAPMPTPRMDCAAVYAYDSIFVVGGQGGEVLSSTLLYNPTQNDWKEGPSLSTARYGHGLVVSPL
ncbi:hypothetical protein Efla_000435 [Eimeria flavescens]